MQRFLVLPIAIAFLIPATVSVSEDLNDFPKDGLWRGGVGDPLDKNSSWQPLEIVLKRDGDQLTGTLIHTSDRPWPSKYKTSGTIRGSQIQLTHKFNYGRETGKISGKFENGVLQGKWTTDEQLPFILIYQNAVPSTLAKSASGTWYGAAGQELIVMASSNRAAYVDVKTGQVRRLVYQGERTFRSGPTLAIQYPFENKLELATATQGKQPKLVFRSADGKNRVEYTKGPENRAEDFEYESFDGTKIRGTLWLPKSTEPVGAVVWVHGSGKADRQNVGHWRYFFSSRGIAVVAFDKRGVGKSDGKYELPNGGRDNVPHMARRAKDVAAAVNAIGKHPAIDPDKIGMAGGSQAGWVIPQAASGCQPAWVMVLSGGATRLDYETWFSDLAKENGIDDDTESIPKIIKKIRDREAKSPSIRPYFEKMNCPGLWHYGMHDRSNPSQLCIELLQDIKTKSGKDFTVSVFETGNHALLDAKTGGRAENARLARFVPDLFSRTEQWLKDKKIIDD